MARVTLVVCVIVALGGATSADVSIVALQEPGDPLRLSNERIEFREPGLAVIAVTVENLTLQPLSTRQILLSASRFLTKSDADATGRLSMACGMMGHVDGAARAPAIIPPGASAVVEMSIDLTATCRRDPQHDEHFFVYVYFVSASPDGKLREPAWQRTSADVARLLAAAMPHP